MEAHLVEGEGGESVGVVVCLDMEEGAGFEGVALGKEVGSEGVEVVAPGGGEESEVAEIDSEHGDVSAADEVDGTEKGAVAPDGKEEIVGAVGQRVGDDVGVDAVFVQDTHETVYLLARVVFDVADV